MEQPGPAHTAQWRSESGASAPRRVIAADDTLPADTAYRMACEGTGLLWTGDFQNARMLLGADAPRRPQAPARWRPKRRKSGSADLLKRFTCTGRRRRSVRGCCRRC